VSPTYLSYGVAETVSETVGGEPVDGLAIRDCGRRDERLGDRTRRAARAFGPGDADVQRGQDAFVNRISAGFPLVAFGPHLRCSVGLGGPFRDQ